MKYSPTAKTLTSPRASLHILQKFLQALLPIACASVSSALAQSVPAKPNIIVILADDLGYGDVSCNRVNPDFLTPNIDSLAINGVQCTNGYVTIRFAPRRERLC
jgi:arylsulfatase A